MERKLSTQHAGFLSMEFADLNKKQKSRSNTFSLSLLSRIAADFV